MTKLIPFLVAVCLLGAGCIRCHRYVQLWLDASDYDGFETTYENIVGTYHYEGDDQTEIDLYTLEILPDSTYIQTYRKKPGDSTQIKKGRVFLQEEGGAEIDFSMWYDLPCFYCYELRPKPERGYKVTYFFNRNKIDFSTDPDTRNHYFVRDKKL